MPIGKFREWWRVRRGLSPLSSPVGSMVVEPTYLLRDEFSGDLAAGSVNGTSAVPGPGTRTVVDTNGIMSIADGVLVVNGTPAADDRFHIGSVARIIGWVFKATLPTVVTASINSIFVGWSTDGGVSNSGVPAFIYNDATSVYVRDGGLGVYAVTLGAAPHYLAAVTRATGGWTFAFISNLWRMTYIHSTDASGTLFPKFILPAAVAMNFTYDAHRVPQSLYIPTPLCYDTFGRANGTLGNSETTGPDSQTTEALAWTGSTYTISSNAAINTPTLGSDVIVNGGFGADTNWSKGAGWTIAAGTAVATVASSDLTASVAPLTTGTWYQTAFTQGGFSAGTVAVVLGTTVFPTHNTNATFTETGRATSTAFALRGSGLTDTVDNVSAQPLTLSTLFASINVVSTADVHARVAVTLDGALLGKQAGLVLNLDSAASPANFIIAYLNGNGNAVLDECVAGTYTNKISAAVTYSAGAYLYVIRRGTSCWLFYNNAQVGTVQTMTANTNKLFGLFSTSSLSSLDAFELWPDGGNGEHAALNGF